MTNYRFRSRIDNEAYRLPIKPNQDLEHIPGPKAGWIGRHIFRFLKNDNDHIAYLAEKYGDVFSMPSLIGRKAVFMVGAEANKVVLGNADKIFSNHRAYLPIKMFVGDSVATRDFEDHAELRKLISQPFSGSAMPDYLARINENCDKHFKKMVYHRNNEVQFYPFVKALALDIAADVFAGIELGSEAGKMNKSLQQILNLVNAKIPIPLPGTVVAKGLKGRSYADGYFRSLIPSRRESKSTDLFTRLCIAENDLGERLNDQDIIDNVIGAMIAGHDTSTIAMTALAYELAKSPDRQSKLAAKCETIHQQTGAKFLKHSDLSQLGEIDLYIKEVLRMYTPVRYIQRRLVKDFEFKGHKLFANTNVILAIHQTHLSRECFEHPERFYPERFGNNSKYSKIPNYAWAPFGKGAHLCIGMQFAMLEIKALLYHLLINYEIQLPTNHSLEMSGIPVSKPKGNVPLVLKPRNT